MKALQKELAPGERLAWIGRPIPIRLATRKVGFAVIGALLFGVGLFYAAPLFLKSPSLLGGVFVFPILGGLLTSIAWPIWTYVDGTWTVYAISDRRILIIKDCWLYDFDSYAPADIQKIKSSEREDATGNVIFRTERSEWLFLLRYLPPPISLLSLFDTERDIGLFAVKEVTSPGN